MLGDLGGGGAVTRKPRADEKARGFAIPPAAMDQATQVAMAMALIQAMRSAGATGGIISIEIAPASPLVDRLGQALTEAVDWIYKNSESEFPTGVGPYAPLARWARAADEWGSRKKAARAPAPPPEAT